MSDATAYVVIAALAILLLFLAASTKGLNPALTVIAQLLPLVAAAALVEPLVAKAVVALVVAYYAGFFMGRAFEQEKAKPRREAPPRQPKRAK